MATQPPSPYTMPVPKLDEIYRRYAQREIPAALTVYGTICTAREAANYNLLETFPPVDSDIANALAEGFILNYYLHFPSLESDHVSMEGDWSGISLLFKRLPNPQQLANEPPLLACYVKKTETHMMAGLDGYRTWSNVKKLPDQATGLDIHPIVYVSRGLHNCYYEPTATTADLDPPWLLTSQAKKIESGVLAPGPSDNDRTLEGGGIMDGPWWADILFPPFFFKMCASGCKYPVRFDSSGVPVDPRAPAEDEVRKDGNTTAPPGADTGQPLGSPDYPTQTTASPLRLDVTYVDLDDANMADWWKFAGGWGAARLAGDWGSFLGRERPNLAAWFLWNLYWNTTFGSSGKGANRLGP